MEYCEYRMHATYVHASATENGVKHGFRKKILNVENSIQPSSSIIALTKTNLPLAADFFMLRVAHGTLCWHRQESILSVPHITKEEWMTDHIRERRSAQRKLT